MSSGYIKLHRKLCDWEWYADPNASRLFLHLLLTANYEPQRWQGMVIKPGQLLTGRSRLASALGLSVQEIRTSLNKLKSTSEITIRSTNKYSVITICKWDQYQFRISDNQPAIQPATQLLSNQRSTTVKERIERIEIKEKKKNTVDHFKVFWDAYDKKTGREKCLDKWQDLTDLEIERILIHVPRYAESTPEVQFRKNPLTYLNGKHWEDEIISPNTKQNQSNRTVDGKIKLAI